MGTVIQCPKCANKFRFEDEDVKQKDEILCPMCLGINAERFKETEVLNEVVGLKAIEMLSGEVKRSKEETVNQEQIEKIVTAELLKDLPNIRSVFLLENAAQSPLIGSAKIKLGGEDIKPDDSETTDKSSS
jgi:hypothetical protein